MVEFYTTVRVTGRVSRQRLGCLEARKSTCEMRCGAAVTESAD